MNATTRLALLLGLPLFAACAPKPEAAPASYEIQGHAVQGRRLTITVNGNVVAGSDVAVFPVEGEGARLVSCGGRVGGEAAERCKLLLGALFTAPWRADAARGVKV